MRCEEILPNLPLYLDDILDNDDRVAIESHLPACPLCRDELADYRELRVALGQLGKPSIPEDLKKDLAAISKDRMSPQVSFGPVLDTRSLGERIAHWTLPFGAGALGSAAFAMLFLSFMLVRPGIGLLDDNPENAAQVETTPRTLAQNGISDDYLRVVIPDSSPEVNPASALVALTRSIVRGKMSDEEVVVVADVFGNGIANIAEVVDPPDNEEAMRELKRAFETSPENAPFLPTELSKDSDAVRVVLKIQRVDVMN